MAPYYPIAIHQTSYNIALLYIYLDELRKKPNSPLKERASYKLMLVIHRTVKPSAPSCIVLLCSIMHSFALMYFTRIRSFRGQNLSLREILLPVKSPTIVFQYGQPKTIMWITCISATNHKYAYKTSFHISGSPGKHQWLQSWRGPLPLVLS